MINLILNDSHPFIFIFFSQVFQFEDSLFDQTLCEINQKSIIDEKSLEMREV